jgi:hypothetical protein
MSVITLKGENLVDIDNPPVGFVRFFMDAADGKMKIKYNNGTIKAVIFDNAGAAVDKNYVQSFVNVDTAIVVHNLGKIPNVFVIDDSTGKTFVVETTYDLMDIDNKLTVSWVGLKTGRIICN